MTMSDEQDDQKQPLRPVLELVPDRIKRPSAQQRRLFELPPTDADTAILYQHSVLCQTCMPFRDPGDEVRQWERANGMVSLLLGRRSGIPSRYTAVLRCRAAFRAETAAGAVSPERGGTADAIARDRVRGQFDGLCETHLRGSIPGGAPFVP